MRCLQALFAFLVLVATAYLLLRLFSRLFGVDVLQVMTWQIKQKELLWPAGWAFLFLIGFLPFLALLEKPFTAVTMSMTHQGAMLGYAANDDQAMVYDPQRKEYQLITVFMPPRAASSFKETFETVAYYRPFLTGTYQNVEAQGYLVSVIMLIITAIVFGTLPLLTYRMVDEYLQKQRLSPRLSFQAVLDNCKAWTGYSLPVVLIAAVLFAVIAVIVSGYLVNRVKAGYDEEFAAAREDFRSQLMSAVAPGKTLKGRVINRMRDVQTHTEQRSMDSDQKISERETVIVKHSVYTIEFNKLLKYDPVYLRISLSGDAGTSPQIKQLDELFAPDGAPGADGFLARYDPRDARDPRDMDFVVNDDYSVSLANVGK